MSKVVLDASDVIALLRHEGGADLVWESAPVAIVSAVSLAENAAWMSDEGMPDFEARLTLDDLELEVVPFDRETALVAGSLRSATRHKGLSLGDRACLALARQEGAPVLTADRTWAELDLGVEIRLIRD